MAMYSFSQLQQFVQCELRYAYRYVLKYPEPKTTSLALILGSAVHDTLEWLYKRVSFQTIPLYEDVVKQYQEQWNIQLEGVQEQLDPEQLTEYHQRGMSYLDRYYQEYAPFDKKIPMEMEKNIHFTIGGGHKMRGKIDRLDIDGHDLTIVDYKTSRKWADDKHDEYRSQITLYAKALQQDYGTKLKKLYGKVVYLHLHNEVEREILPEAIDAIEQEYVDIITQIEQKKATWADVQGLFADGTKVWDIFASSKGSWCTRCPFKELCPEFAHAFVESEQVSAGDLSPETIQVMLDQYVELAEQYKSLGKKIDSLKDQLTEYAVKNDFARLYGQGASVGVTSKDIRSLSSEQREEAESYLHEHGLWDDAVSVNHHAITRLVKEGLLDEMIECGLVVNKKSRYLGQVKKEK